MSTNMYKDQTGPSHHHNVWQVYDPVHFEWIWLQVAHSKYVKKWPKQFGIWSLKPHVKVVKDICIHMSSAVWTLNFPKMHSDD